MNIYLKEILKEMCSRVKTNFNDIDFKKDNWFFKYAWTLEEENNFKNWMIDYIFKNNKARKEIFTCSRNKKQIKKGVDAFILNYGWKLYEQKKNK